MDETTKDIIGIARAKMKELPYYSCQTSVGVTLEQSANKKKCIAACDSAHIKAVVYEITSVGTKTVVHKNWRG